MVALRCDLRGSVSSVFSLKGVGPAWSLLGRVTNHLVKHVFVPYLKDLKNVFRTKHFLPYC